MKLPDFNKWFLPITIPLFTIVGILAYKDSFLVAFIISTLSALVAYFIVRIISK